MANVPFTASANATPASTITVATRTVNSIEYQVIQLGDAAGSILGTSGSPLHVIGTIVATQGASGASPWGARIVDSAGSQYGYGTASPLFVQQTNFAGSAAGSPLFVAEVRSAGSAAGSPLFVQATGGSVALLAGANTIGVASVIQSGTWTFSASVTSDTASPVFVQISDGTDTVTVDAASRLQVAVTNLAGSAAGSPLFAQQTNFAGSAAGSPLFVSEVRSAGSAAGSPLFASITNLAGSAAGSPLFTRVGDGTDTAFVDAACRLAITLTDGTNAYGLPASPLSNTGEATKIWWGGCLLTLAQANVSAASAACTAVVASLAGFSTVIVAATYTTSSCQFIGWTACGNNGGASATVQTAMPFGTNGGMDSNRLPHGYLWQFPSGSIAVMTTTSACVVAGTINYLRVAS